MGTIAVILDTESSSAAYFDANTDDTENITCFLLSKRNPSPLVHNIAKTYKDPTTEPSMYSVQVSTLLTNHVQNTTEPNSYTIHVVSSAVGALVASLFVGFLLKKCLKRTGNNIDPMDAHVWTLPHGRAGPGLFRSASLPDMTSARLTVPDDPASCRALIAILQHSYCEIPDNIAAAQRPLPALPHTYCEIPDHIAAAQRPLPALPPTYDEIPDNIAAQRPLSVPSLASYSVLQWKVTEKGSQIIARPRPFPVLPNTYWPWSLPGEEPHNTECHEPPVPSILNTYWPWEIPVKTKPQNDADGRCPRRDFKNLSCHE
ncbi:hypothetical protein Bbelb_341470 [Branchiostoma belcheri]|nr:hypothetical protein Bbelb_341470 [Branchiostoma belcheri]